MRKLCALAPLAAVLALVAAAPAPAAVNTTHSGWQWGNPLPQGKGISDIDFAGGRGFAAGEFGTVLRTDDGGSTWTGLRSGSRENLTRVRAIDSGIFVVGGGCTLLRSDDTGQTFRRLRFSASTRCGAELTAFDFPSSGVGYLFRSDGTVLRTDDGGRTFSGRAPVPGVGGGFRANDAHFTDPGNGWVVTGGTAAGRIYRTTNGGASWDEVASTARALRSITFPNLGRGYAVGDGGGFLRSDDAGATWTPIDIGEVPSLSKIECVNANDCALALSGADRIGRTTGGGSSFSTVEPNPNNGVAINTVTVTPPSGIVAAGQRGATFLAQFADSSLSRTGGAIPGTYRRLRATSSSVLHAAGDAGSVARSLDGGQSWTRVGVPTSAQIVDVAFPTANLGYALDSNGAVFRTENGGASWGIVGSGGQARAIAASSDGQTVLLIGPRGIRRSANGGEQFDEVESSVVGSRGFFDVDDGVGSPMIVYASNAIVFSGDGGRSWSALRRPSRSKIVDLDFTDSKRGWVLTADGRLWRTSNRGRNWAESLAHGTTRGRQIAFGSSTDGWLAVSSFAGDGHLWLLHTTDGGASWRPQLVDSSAGPVSLIGAGAAGPGALLSNSGGVTDFFRTDTGGDLGDPSTIRLRSRTTRISGSTRVEVTGSTSPSVAGAEVQISTRPANSGRWRSVTVETSSEGRFRARFRISSTSYFVAQWAGDALRRGDGSGRLTIRRR